LGLRSPTPVGSLHPRLRIPPAPPCAEFFLARLSLGIFQGNAPVQIPRLMSTQKIF